MRRLLSCFSILVCYGPIASAQDMPAKVGTFRQQAHVPYVVGLPSTDVTAIAIDTDGAVVVETAGGAARFVDGAFAPVATAAEWEPVRERVFSDVDGLGLPDDVQQIGGAVFDGDQFESETALATANGLLLSQDGETFTFSRTRQGDVCWMPLNVAVVGYDRSGHLWFGCPQGVGYRVADDDWRLFTGADGLPFNEFTCFAAGPDGVWFGTTNGAIHYRDGVWEFRQGRRWLLDNYVNDIAIDDAGNAWIATPAGVSCIESRPMTLEEKAAYFDEEVEKYHRRTPFGYVSRTALENPGDKSSAVPTPSDNDGHYTGLYLAAASFAYDVTKDPAWKEKAANAFEAVAFLGTVTEGGTHPVPGFIARCVRPTDGPDPNEDYGAEYNRRRLERDGKWKQILPRWPIDETGEWYWLCDSSSDELDGHFFGFGIYYDRVCQTEAERERVRAAVRPIADHLIDNGYMLRDHDGKGTRWGRFAPEEINQNEEWVVERGLNSISILTFLSVAHHITGDQKYRDAYMTLAIDHGYAMNGATQPKYQLGPGSFGQGDDRMAFMNYYHLLRYESDPKLLSMYYEAVRHHWQIEKCEANPLLNFIYAACCLGKVRVDQWGEEDLSPDPYWLSDSIDTLKRFPLDLIDWPLSNAHRIDRVPLPDFARGGDSEGFGMRVDGRCWPVDERGALTWGHDPWLLENGGDGSFLTQPTPFLLGYYMGRAHGFIND